MAMPLEAPSGAGHGRRECPPGFCQLSSDPVASMKHGLSGAVQAAILLIAHFGVAAVVILTIYAGETLFHTLWHSTEPTLFDHVPVRYMFDAIDAGVITTFGFWGILHANKAFRG
jgi:hypothetical protein